MHLLDLNHWDLDIDHWLNSCVPRNRLEGLPAPVSRFLGLGSRQHVGNILVAWWALFGAFAGIVLIEAMLMIPEIQDHGAPIVIASFGAAAILEYNVIESPLAQPRNSLFGHFLAALVGVGITKLFMLHTNFENLRWLAGALACGLASAVMVLAKAVYPPAGATALLAAVDPEISRLGWYMPPLVLLCSTLTLIASLLVNNIQRRYPMYWWTPAHLGRRCGHDIEKVRQSSASSGPSRSRQVELDPASHIIVSPDKINVPGNMQLTREEQDIIEILRHRLTYNISNGPAT